MQGCLCPKHLRHKAASSPHIIPVMVDVGLKPQTDLGGTRKDSEHCSSLLGMKTPQNLASCSLCLVYLEGSLHCLQGDGEFKGEGRKTTKGTLVGRSCWEQLLSTPPETSGREC